MKERKKPKQTRFLGSFKITDKVRLFGELLLDGPRTNLTLNSDTLLPYLRSAKSIIGTSLEGDSITCIDCVGMSQQSTTKAGNTIAHVANVFPHFVVIGNKHLDPLAQTIKSIQFSVDDISTLFPDFDTFGLLLNAAPVMDAVLIERGIQNHVKLGKHPHVAYFTGKNTVLEVDTLLGKLSVEHRPSFNTGGPNGVYIKNRMVMSIEPAAPVDFEEIIDRMLCLCRFLSVLAGRQQRVRRIQLQIDDATEAPHESLRVYWTYSPKCKATNNANFKPHFRDIPLDPIRRPQEFSDVIRHWIHRDTDWRTSRVRYIHCLSKGNAYGVDRLVAAANMFDVLPSNAVPLTNELPTELASFQTNALETLRSLKFLSTNLDRNSAISAISRMGQPSLPKKALHRFELIEKQLGPQFSGIRDVIKLAIKFRNHFVHGGSDDFDFDAAEPFLGFFTDTLEFVFATSDFVEAGWDLSEWCSQPHSTGHSFAKFLWEYEQTYDAVKKALLIK